VAARVRLRILHLFANFKWTGPAAPAIRCAEAQRRLGADVVFAEAAWTLPGAEHRMRIELEKARLPVLGGLELRKHFHPLSLLRDMRALRARIERGEFEVLHCHLLADHLLAALVLRRARHQATLVRSLYDPQPPRREWRTRLAFRHTAGTVVPTADCGRQLARRFRIPPARVLVQDPPVDPPGTEGDLRARWQLGSEQPVVGITARIQPHRRFDLLWQTARLVVDAEPRTVFVLLGRGNETDTRELVEAPVARLGLQGNVRLPGYLYEPDYGRALRSLDLFLFLVPGSDGTCRAVREAMAHGLPVVAMARGILPELLAAHDGAGPAGLVCQEDAGALSRALLSLIRNPALRRELGEAGRRRALGAMSPEPAARRLLDFYLQLRQSGA
jgi:glycosyltransferase involved in cell wall biosynthesis